MINLATDWKNTRAPILDWRFLLKIILAIPLSFLLVGSIFVIGEYL